MATREEMSRSFGAAADAYETGRPGYPAEAVAWMLQPVVRPGARPRVADVGAGTGKLTRVLLEIGAETVAVEPDVAMLERLRETVPGVPTFVGTAVGHSFTSEPVSVIFLTLAGGSILYVVIQLLAIAGRSARKDLIYTGVLIGLLAGFLTDAVVTAAGV